MLAFPNINLYKTHFYVCICLIVYICGEHQIRPSFSCFQAGLLVLKREPERELYLYIV